MKKYILVFILVIFSIQGYLIYKYSQDEIIRLKKIIKILEKENKRANDAEAAALKSKIKSEKESELRYHKIRSDLEAINCSNYRIPYDIVKRLYDHARRIR